ncbi:MAG: glycosyltransferase family 4 protein [Chloroflexota bacterium]
MRLAIFWHDLLHYHAARIHALVAYAKEMGHTVQAYILCAQPDTLWHLNYHEQLADHVQILSHDPLQAGEFSQRSKHQLLQALDQFQPDVVAIIGYTGPVSRAALGWCRAHQRGAVLMLSSHAADYTRVWWKEWPKRQLVCLYDAAIVSGTRQADYARQLGLSPERIRTGYGVVDNEFWRNGAALVRANRQSGQRDDRYPIQFFLTACRFVPKKNLSGLLNAYAMYVAQAETNPWPLVIVGDGPLAPMLQQQVHDLNLTHLVHFPGYLSSTEMATVYGLASTFVLASAYAEQWGLVVNEAMAAGLPVLVSEICGCVPDLVLDGETGFAFDPGDGQALATLLGTFSSGGVDTAAMGEKAQRYIQHFSPAVFAQNLFVVAEQAIRHAERRRWSMWPSPYFWR